MSDERTTAEDAITPDESPTTGSAGGARPDPAPAKHEGDALLEPDPAPPADAPEEADGPGPEPEPQADATDYLAVAQRTQADFDNYRKRTARELRAAEARGTSRVVKELLPALDHLHLALQNLAGPEAEGVRLVQRELLGALARVGVEPYSPEGEPFDPQVHEAVAQVPQPGVETGTVFEVLQHGYRHGDAVLRPARVVVTG